MHRPMQVARSSPFGFQAVLPRRAAGSPTKNQVTYLSTWFVPRVKGRETEHAPPEPGGRVGIASLRLSAASHGHPCIVSLHPGAYRHSRNGARPRLTTDLPLARSVNSPPDGNGGTAAQTRRRYYLRIERESDGNDERKARKQNGSEDSGGEGGFGLF